LTALHRLKTAAKLRWRQWSQPAKAVAKRPSTMVWLLLGAYLVLLLYASMYPFIDWRDKGLAPWAFVLLPAPRFVWTSFDNVTNVLGYIPLGFLAAWAWLRSVSTEQDAKRWYAQAWVIGLAVLAGGSFLSFVMECTQSYLPERVPSKLDWATNTSGTALGASAALAMNRWGVLARWSLLRSRWFVADSQAGVTLLALWPLALLFPTAVPLGLGHVLERVTIILMNLLPAFDAVFATPVLAADFTPLTPMGEMVCVCLGLLGPALLMHAMVTTLARRAIGLGLLLMAGWVMTSLSSALSFGPVNAWAWWTLPTQVGLIAAGVLALAALKLSRRTCAALGLVVVVLHVSSLNQAAASAYFWQTLQTWEQGRFIHFHGVTQVLGWVWPYLAAVVLFQRAVARPRYSGDDSLAGIRR
jgi:VanZ family protein